MRINWWALVLVQLCALGHANAQDAVPVPKAAEQAPEVTEKQKEALVAQAEAEKAEAEKEKTEAQVAKLREQGKLADKKAEAEQKKETKEKEKEIEEATREFAGLRFGVGIGLMIGGYTDKVEEAELVTSVPEDSNQSVPNVVRITKRSDDSARVFLETHYFFESDFWLPLGKIFGLGPFIALQPGTEEIIKALGGGGMLGLRRNETTKESFNIGVGVIVEPNTKTLGDGIEPNQPLPAGETEIRYQTKSTTALLLLASFSF